MSYSDPNASKANQICNATQWVATRLKGFALEGIENMNGRAYAIVRNKLNQNEIRHIDSQVFMTV